jgi:hypothetical protein
MRVSGTINLLMIATLMMTFGVASAQEPLIPRVDLEFSGEKELAIDQLENRSLETVFEAFRSPQFFDQEEYLDKAIFDTLNYRTDEAVSFMMRYVQSTNANGKPDSARNLYIAKRVARVFPDEALNSLLDLYSSAGPKVRANVIYVIGQMAGGEVIKTLLLEALYDTTHCQEANPEMVGAPMRICDVAYNQLVMRYKVKNVLRIIGTGHAIDVRDYHIQQLLERL